MLLNFEISCSNREISRMEKSMKRQADILKFHARDIAARCSSQGPSLVVALLRERKRGNIIERSRATGELTPQSTVNDFQWRLDVSITLRQSESDADIRTNGQWESAKCSQRAFNPVNTRGVYWGFHPAITVNDGTYETLFSRRVCSLHTSCKYSVTRPDG